MDLIPVIDLLQGQVVRGMQGNRSAYRPIVSALCGSSAPVTVAQILCEYSAARQLYVADLDALQGGAVQRETLRHILAALPGIELWLDAGFADIAPARALVAELGPRVVPVYASESLRSPEALARCTGSSQAILSLDRREGRRMDPAGAWDRPALWPRRVIVMTLERVGAGTGPDLETLREVAALQPESQLIGAGGIASEADLIRAGDAGASAWLVASALHDLRLPHR